MQIQSRVGDITEIESDLLVVNHFEHSNDKSEVLLKIDRALGGTVHRVIEDGDFQGRSQETLLLYTNGALTVPRVLIVGLGNKEELDLEIIRRVSAAVARRVRDLGISTFSTVLHGAGAPGINLAEAAQSVVEGMELALYEFNELKTDVNPTSKRINELILVLSSPAQLAEVEPAVRAAQAIVASVTLARDLVNWPGNYATPTFLATRAIEIANECGLVCHVLDKAEMEELNMGALLAVARGSNEPPKFIILEHNSDRSDLETIVLVGKAITFDSGGISLKPREEMDRMKSDMAGGAVVLAALRAVAALDLPIHLVGLIPAAENMPSGTSYKPGDVVTAMNGRTIEIISTDAEGRMVLADGLVYAARYSPRAVIDIATLTAARTVALGDHAIALFSNDDDLAARFQAAGNHTFERTWRMPLFPEYREQLKSYVADLKHSGGAPAGAITAAVFLGMFINKIPWVHLDIAGLVSTTVERYYTPRWATGLGVRLLVQFLRDWALIPTHSPQPVQVTSNS